MSYHCIIDYKQVVNTTIHTLMNNNSTAGIDSGQMNILNTPQIYMPIHIYYPADILVYYSIIPHCICFRTTQHIM